MIRYFIVIFLFTVTSILSQTTEPKVSIQQSEYDFGNINQGETVNHSFLITNTGSDLLKLSDIKASCGCTAAVPDKQELKPGESTQIVVTFNSTGRKGPQTKIVNIKTNDPSNPVIKLTIKGNIIVSENKEKNAGAVIYFPETQHNFGTVKEGDVLTYNFTFENKGTQPLIIKDVKSSCGCTAAIVSEKTLKPGQSGTIKVEFDTKGRLEKATKTIAVISNDNKDPNKIITIFADITKK